MGAYAIGVGRDQYSGQLLEAKLGVMDYKSYVTVEGALNALQRGEIDILFENQDVVNYLIIEKGLNGEIIL